MEDSVALPNSFTTNDSVKAFLSGEGRTLIKPDEIICVTRIKKGKESTVSLSGIGLKIQKK